MSIVYDEDDKSQTSAQAFKYSPLSNPTTVRILQLHSASNVDEPLQATLKTVDLAEDPTYSALSYTWGHPVYGYLPARPFAFIRVNGDVLSVTPNLFDALVQLRQSYSDRMLWIDAICINQEDLAERSAQVSMMQRIFRCARAVIVWFGAVQPKYEAALSMISLLQVAQGDSYANLEEAALDHHLNSFDGCEPREVEATCRDLFALQYFRRIWVVKEILVANQIIILTPIAHVSWEQIVVMAQLVGYVTHQTATNFATWTPKSPYALALPALSMHRNEQKLSLESLLSQTRGLNATDPRDKVFALLSLAFDLTDNSSSTASLETVLQMIDRPYVDYTLSVSEAYERCSRWLLRRELGWFLLVWVGDSGAAKQDLPSWVPDFSIPLRPNPLRPLGDRTFSCGNALESVYKVSNSRLRLAGKKADTITAVGEDYDTLIGKERMTLILRLLADLDETYPTGDTTTVDALWRTMVAFSSRDSLSGSNSYAKSFRQQFVNWCIRALQVAEESAEDKERTLSSSTSSFSSFRRHRPSWSDEIVDRLRIAPTLWRLPSGGSSHHHEHDVPEELYKPFAIKDAIKAIDKAHHDEFPLLSLIASARENLHVWHHDSPRWQTAPHIQREDLFSRSFQLKYKDRRLFRTKHGYLGIGPASTQPGDVVYIIGGARCPFVCRDVGEEDCFRLVGEAYLHGIMHGEPMVGVKDHEVKHIWLV